MTWNSEEGSDQVADDTQVVMVVKLRSCTEIAGRLDEFVQLGNKGK